MSSVLAAPTFQPPSCSHRCWDFEGQWKYLLSMLFKHQHTGRLRLQALVVEEGTGAVQKGCLCVSGCSEAGVGDCRQGPLPVVPPCLEVGNRARLGAVSRVCCGHTYRVAHPGQGLSLNMALKLYIWAETPDEASLSHFSLCCWAHQSPMTGHAAVPRQSWP